MKTVEIPILQMKEFLNYDQQTGIFTWIKSPTKSVKIGSIAGSIDGSGHRQVKFRGGIYHLHRVAWAFIHGPIPKGLCIDHIDQDPDNNKLSNLRLDKRKLNKANSPKRKTPSSSKYKGVSIHRQTQKWKAEVRHKGKLHYLGLFVTEREAAHEYDRVAKELFGEYACTNFK